MSSLWGRNGELSVWVKSPLSFPPSWSQESLRNCASENLSPLVWHFWSQQNIRNHLNCFHQKLIRCVLLIHTMGVLWCYKKTTNKVLCMKRSLGFRGEGSSQFQSDVLSRLLFGGCLYMLQNLWKEHYNLVLVVYLLGWGGQFWQKTRIRKTF